MGWVKNPAERLLSAHPEPEIGEVRLRGEAPGDARQIRDLLEASFPGDGEAGLVDRLRHDRDIVLSLVAEDGGVVIGYICFSRLVVETSDGRFSGVALAPLAVYGEYQNRGVATKLVQEAHACLATLGETLSVVLGEPHFYGRFGYSNRRVMHFASDYQSPYLMALSFGAAPYAGRLIYATAFAHLGTDDAPHPPDDRL